MLILADVRTQLNTYKNKTWFKKLNYDNDLNKGVEILLRRKRPCKSKTYTLLKFGKFIISLNILVLN